MKPPTLGAGQNYCGFICSRERNACEWYMK